MYEVFWGSIFLAAIKFLVVFVLITLFVFLLIVNSPRWDPYEELLVFYEKVESRYRVKEVQSPKLLRRAIVFKAKCGKLSSLYLETSEYDKFLHCMWNEINSAKKRTFFYEREDEVLEDGGIINCYLEIDKIDSSCWTIKCFGMDAVEFDFLKFRILVDTVKTEWLKDSLLIIEVSRWDKLKIEILDFCGFEVMDNPPYEIGTDNRVIYYLPDIGEGRSVKNV